MSEIDNVKKRLSGVEEEPKHLPESILHPFSISAKELRECCESAKEEDKAFAAGMLKGAIGLSDDCELVVDRCSIERLIGTATPKATKPNPQNAGPVKPNA